MTSMNSKQQDASPDTLWCEYQKNRDSKIREILVEHYLPLVKIIVGRIAISLPSHVDRDDLISSGFFGLLDAIERYDPIRGNKFETYAGVRIRGSILDYLRSKDWIPVSLRQKIRRYEQAVSTLEGKLGRAATDQEVADYLEISLDNLQQIICQINVATVIPLEEYIRTEKVDTSLISPVDSLEAKELQESLAEAIEKLPEKERIVVSLYYYDELTLREISVILKLSEARISQLHTKAIFRLRGKLARSKASFL